MNAERLHAIVEALKAETGETGYPDLLDQLVEGLKNTAESPRQPGPQEQASAARESAPATAVLFTLALERLLKVYQQILDIRLKHRELAENNDLPDEVLKPIADHVSEKMKAEIGSIAEDVISRAKLDDDGRLNELRNELTRQLDELAERIDRGFDVEVRAGEIPESTEDELDEAEVGRDTREAARTVLEAQKNLEFMNVSGKPILHLVQGEADAIGGITDDVADP